MQCPGWLCLCVCLIFWLSFYFFFFFDSLHIVQYVWLAIPKALNTFSFEPSQYSYCLHMQWSSLAGATKHDEDSQTHRNKNNKKSVQKKSRCCVEKSQVRKLNWWVLMYWINESYGSRMYFVAYVQAHRHMCKSVAAVMCAVLAARLWTLDMIWIQVLMAEQIVKAKSTSLMVQGKPWNKSLWLCIKISSTVCCLPVLGFI